MVDKKDAPVDVPERAVPVAPADPTPAQQILGATFAERAAAAKKASTKAVANDDTEDKSVSSSQSKSRRSSK